MGEWQHKGFREEASQSRPGLIKKLGWKLAEDMKQYELLDNAKHITMPIMLLSGQKDKITPPSIQEEFFKLVSTSKKELHIINNAGHNFRTKTELEEIENIMKDWAKKQITN